jgi:dephospho-CoA kinase
MPEYGKIIGLTGGIGVGKSAVARIVEELGAFVIRADNVGHDVYAPGTPGWQKIVDAFGRQILAADGTIDRKHLGRIVFSDTDALRRLNSIVHPLIRDEVKRRITERHALEPQRPIVVEAAVLIEANWTSIVDEVWVIVAPATKVAARIAAERGLSHDDIRARIAAQLDQEERRAHADVLIDNAGSLDELRREVEAAWRRSTSC